MNRHKLQSAECADRKPGRADEKSSSKRGQRSSSGGTSGSKKKARVDSTKSLGLADDSMVAMSFYMMRIMTDPVPSEVKDMYLFSYPPTGGNDSVFPRVAEWVAEAPGRKLYVLDSVPGLSTYMGFEYTKDLLVSKHNVATETIVRVPFPKEHTLIHTRNESDALVMYMKTAGIQSFAVCAAPFHLPRAFLSMLGAAKEASTLSAAHIYPMCGTGYPKWFNTPVIHSQGMQLDHLANTVPNEFDRIERYIANGHLLTISESLTYLQERDASHER